METGARSDALEPLLRLHREIDAEAAELQRTHVDRLRCRRGCHGCCVDGITVFEIEAERIRRQHSGLLDSGSPHGPGACSFLDDDGACRIYDDRPYVCRTQGLPLRWLDRDDSGRTVEQRDICPLNERPGSPITALAAEDCWTLGPAEDRLRTMAGGSPANPPNRVALRDLFARRWRKT